jgi:hypothetical protein
LIQELHIEENPVARAFLGALQMFFRHTGLAVVACVALAVPPRAHGQIRPDQEALARASPELIERLRADPFTYFRFVNRPWTTRVCAAFADVRDLPAVRLHGDAHMEQFALTKDAWGLDDFDDSTRGPVFIDIVRFIRSIDLATRQRGWTRDREALRDRFFEGLRRGLSTPDCLEGPTTPPALRIIDGTQQLGRVKHDILAVGPRLLVPSASDRPEHWLEWWLLSWEPSYREVQLGDLRSVEDLSAIVYDAGVQLGTGEAKDTAVRKQGLSSLVRLESRLRKEAFSIVEELLAGWRELGGR